MSKPFRFPPGWRLPGRSAAVIPLAEGDRIEIHLGHEERNEEDEP